MVPDDSAPRLETAIRNHLAPLLRGDGFSGSGRTFRRVTGQWIHVVNVQGSLSGGQFAVNLAVHPLSVPDLEGDAPDPRRITVEQCEFRRRMSDSVRREDRWWAHDATTDGMAAAMRDAASTYSRIGRKLLLDATAEGADLNAGTCAAFVAGSFEALGFASTRFRMAFALAHVRKIRGETAEARAFAEHALELAGSSVFHQRNVRQFLKHLEQPA